MTLINRLFHGVITIVVAGALLISNHKAFAEKYAYVEKIDIVPGSRASFTRLATVDGCAFYILQYNERNAIYVNRLVTVCSEGKSASIGSEIGTRR